MTSKGFQLLPQSDPDFYPVRSNQRLLWLKNRVDWKNKYLIATVTTLLVGAICGVGIFARTVHHRGEHQEVPNFPTVHKIFDLDEAFFGIPEAYTNAAWESMIPEGKGFVQLPNSNGKGSDEDDSNIYCLSVFHQLHCLNLLRTSYYDLAHPDHASNHGDAHSHHGHLDHCFEYLRQSILCAGDTSLEPRDAIHHGVQGWGTTHTCRNFNDIFSWTEKHRSNDNFGIV